jgi:hypothetical protein
LYDARFVESQQAESPPSTLATVAEVLEDAAFDVIVEIGSPERGDGLHVSEREILSVQGEIVDVVMRYQSS